MRTDDQPELFTFKRCAIAGVWSAVVIVVARSLIEDAVGSLLMIPLIGLPWLFFELSDKERKKETMAAGEAVTLILGGAFISAFCALPWVFVAGILMKMFK